MKQVINLLENRLEKVNLHRKKRLTIVWPE